MLNSREIEIIKHDALNKYLSCTTTYRIQRVKEFIKHMRNKEKIQISMFLDIRDRKKLVKMIEDLGHSPKIISERGTHFLIVKKQILEEIIPPSIFNINFLDLPKGAN